MDEVKQLYRLARCPFTHRRYCHYCPRRGPRGARVDDTCPHFQNRNRVAYCMYHPNMKRLRDEHEQMRKILAQLQALLPADLPATPTPAVASWRYAYNNLPKP